MTTKINVKGGATLPRAGDVGIDLFSQGDYIIAPLSSYHIRTGVSLELPRNIWAMVAGRSSKSTIFHIAGGIIDPGYRGEIVVIVYNISQTESIEIKKREKFAQLILMQNLNCDIELVEVEDINTNTTRGCGGFGSTD